MRLCGISSCFQLLSPCIRQVTHALLTRPPLSSASSVRKLPMHNSVRLACVRHAASVHPEPGSNSLVCLFFPSGPTWSFLLYCFFLVFLFSEFSFCFFRIFRVALLFICQGSVSVFLSDATSLFYHVFFFLSRPFSFFLFLSIAVLCGRVSLYLVQFFLSTKIFIFLHFFLTENRAKKEISISQDSFSIYMADNGERGI